MISIENCQKPSENPEVVKLVYFSMRNKYTSVSNPAGLTFQEVRGILEKESVSVIKDNDRIVGIVRTSNVDFRTKNQLGLDKDIDYQNLGMIYIAKKERGQGYAGLVIEHFLKLHKNMIYLAHESNIASNKVAAKHLPFFKKHGGFMIRETYNVYKIEQ